ncbi:MAG: ubiquinol-cytochrome c reductase iron-sulfur subunit [Sphingobacteriaceae bacterium]
MKRKEFITLLGVGAGTVVVASCLGACGKGGDSPSPNPNPNPSPGTLLLTLNTISANQDINFKGWTIQSGIIVAKTGNTYIALSSACTHAGNPINYDGGNNTFPCSQQGAGHGSIFDANGVKLSGPAQSNLTKYTTVLENDTLKVYA